MANDETKDGKVTAETLKNAGKDVTDDVQPTGTKDTYGNRAIGGSPLVEGFQFYLSKPVKRVMENDGTNTLIHSVCIVDASDETLQTTFVVPNSVFYGRCRDLDGTMHSSDDLAASKSKLAYKLIRGSKLAATATKLIERNAIQKYKVTGVQEYECPQRTGGTYFKTLYAIELAD